MKRSAGFTLLELLMVIVIIGAVLSMVGLVAPVSPERQARAEAARLIQVVQAAREGAVLEGVEYGLRLELDAWQLQRREDDDWSSLGARHALPEGLALEVQVSGLALPGDLRQPQLLLLSSDEYSPFVVQLRAGGQVLLAVRGDGLDDPVMHEG